MKTPYFIWEELAVTRSTNNYISKRAQPHGSPGSHLQFPNFRPTFCSGVITDTDTDNKNCGACDNKCKATETCCAGSCIPNQNNCGGCGPAFACAPNQTCCSVGYHDPVFGDIGPMDQFRCVNTGTDPAHCTGCNQPCDMYVDSNGSLASCCDHGVCLFPKNFLFNNTHCGHCNNNCLTNFGPGYHCSNGHCCPNCTEWYDGKEGTNFVVIGGIVGAFTGGLAVAAFNALWGSILDDSIGPGCYSCDTIKKYTDANAACCNGTTCTDLNSDLNNCGFCGKDCTVPTFNKICRNGRCQCPPNLPDECNFQCINLQTSTQFCGRCNVVCSPGSCCIYDPKFGRTCSTIDINTDRNHCGSCGNQCPAGSVCCGGVCKNIESDTRNCGACGHICGPGEVCCDGFCANLKNSDENCGSCNHPCSLFGEPAGSNDCCNGKCVDKQTNTSNCGICGRACTGDQICFQGQCVEPVPIL